MSFKALNDGIDILAEASGVTVPELEGTATEIAVSATTDVDQQATTNTAKIASTTSSLFSSQGGGALTTRPNGIDMIGITTNVNAPGAFNILGSLGVAGRVLVQKEQTILDEKKLR